MTPAVRGGYALREVLAALLVVAILVRIALPAYDGIRLRARASAALEAMEAVRDAAIDYNADTDEWPADAYPGEPPPELAPYLGDGYSFTGDGYALDWERWMLPDGTPGDPDTGLLVGVSLVTTDRRLGEALEALLGASRAHYTLVDYYTLIIASM